MTALPEQVALRLEVCEPLALPRLDQSEGSSGSRDRCPPITAHLAALQLTLPRRVRPRVAHDVAFRQLARPLLVSRYILDRYLLSTAGISTLKSAQLHAEASEKPRLAARRRSRRQESSEVAITALLGHTVTHNTRRA